MSATTIRQKLHQFIDAIEDKKAEAIYTLFEEEMDTDALRVKLIKAERQKHLKGEGMVYNWDTVKEMAVNKSKRNGL